MINADAMLKSVNRLERVFGGETRATQSIGEVAEILTRLLQAEKDAARYQWVRSASVTELSEFCNMIRPNRDSFVDDSVRRTGDNK